MPAVFVHGVPDTHRVWHAAVGRLRRHGVVTLSLPGFGCELPTGFDCTRGLLLWGEKDPYAAPVLGRPDDVAKELEGHWS
jgi:hypothetical protein